MVARFTRRTFIGSVGAGLALAACASTRDNGGAPSGSSDAPPQGPEPGAPREGDIELPAGAVMPIRILGRTGERVSVVGLGGYHIGMQDDPQESLRIIRAALDHGVNFLDNCWDYNDGESERRMGLALQDGYRQKAFLMTKLDGRTRQSAAEQLDQSLKRLRTDVIDLVQIHEVIRGSDPARVFGPDGTMEALLSARQAGKIRYIGFTGHKDPAYHLAMLKAGFDNGFTFDTVQMPLNPMDPHYKSFEKEVLPVLAAHDIGVLGMKPLASGILLESGAVSAPECLRYAMSLPTSVVITGCDTVGVLEQALHAAYTFEPMRREEKEALLARTAPAGRSGQYEPFKNTKQFDGTERNPKWMTSAEL
ncbi:aldo/keto reductase [Polyangium sp. 6x1]|uniref:aldo/keto reductase n=1 Tax=Polyangium sp. 6x1 TaxID=3042689 RepID=UPI00248326AE|nr:aldo/keto reductase [Polyangium sp. 6x1]MDI1446902.1 aldo/keto reductase [Polyangium sp. 6x1]